MKFFIASPWRNKEVVKELESALVLRGHVAWSFLDNGANLATGKGVMEEFKQFGLSMTNWENDPLIENIFKAEIQALKDCETLILLEPSGHSSLAEAGIAYGMGKRVVLVGLAEHPEVIHLICENKYHRFKRRRMEWNLWIWFWYKSINSGSSLWRARAVKCG